MPTYAAETRVTPEKSRAEIERTLARYGASAFGYAYEGDRAMNWIMAQNRLIRIVLPMPTEREFEWTTNHRIRSDSGRYEAWRQAIRQRWRAGPLPQSQV